MVKSSRKITLSSSRDIPFDRLVMSKANVRRIKAGVSIEQLAEDIARRTLLQSITVRPLHDADGRETGMFEIPAGGRRYRALERLVKQKRLAKDAPIPCILREDGFAEEDSLAENMQRAPLHPLDQFRAFLVFREKGMSEEEIAAHQFVSVAVVRQRLRLASVSPRLLEVYADDGMSLDQLMAFTVNGDHARQEQVFEQLAQSSYAREPHFIRRMLTEGAVRITDKRAQFVGVNTYAAAGGAIMRDLFQGDDGGWLQDAGLLDRLAAEKLRAHAALIAAEGWKWIEVAPDFPYGHTFGLRQLRGEPAALTQEESASRAALQAELDGLEDIYACADSLPADISERFDAIGMALVELDDRPVLFNPDETGHAGAFVSIDGSGKVRVERGYVRPDDETLVEADADLPAEADARDQTEQDRSAAPSCAQNVEDEEGAGPISDRLLAELTAHRTLALRHALGAQPDTAFLAALHALTLRAFYPHASESCMALELKSAGFGAQAPGFNDSPWAGAVHGRHQAWLARLPHEPGMLWEALQGFDSDSRLTLFAHCVSLSVNAMVDAYTRPPRALAHADQLAMTLALDMAAAGWEPTVASYLGRVTKAHILASVREARGAQASDRIAHLKRGDMAEQAQELLAGTGWLPQALRTPGCTILAPADPVSAAGDRADEPAETAKQGGTPA
ncbi:ParB/RepB/Spo0J family partition protein [Phyllobacterium sp. 22229]|uniref:ParB/RepB/Spo0J family partition protein n=1 Tax=Phyllobacterium sp. 22229 TaxID=3453895 RepID=UPI003F87AF7B